MSSNTDPSAPRPDDDFVDKSDAMLREHTPTVPDLETGDEEYLPLIATLPIPPRTPDIRPANSDRTTSNLIPSSKSKLASMRQKTKHRKRVGQQAKMI